MNAGQGTHAAVVPGNRRTEQDASTSALFYLFQEVSRLTPPNPSGPLGSGSLSSWLHETSQRHPFPAQTKEELAQVLQTSRGSCQHGSPGTSPYSQVKKMKEKSPNPGGGSPWRVLGLINLQCERLMHQIECEDAIKTLCSPAGAGSHQGASLISVRGDPDKPLSCRKDSDVVASSRPFQPEKTALGDSETVHVSTQQDVLNPAATLDHNANLAPEPSLSNHGPTRAPTGEFAGMKDSATSHPKSTWRTKTPRKQPNPSRSADIQDPHFQGVTFRMDAALDDSREQCRLLITSQFSKDLCKRKPRLRTRHTQKTLRTSSSDDESDATNSGSRGKVCASCCTRKTPMWRDAEDGTPLCNACGIRYKKYRVRCLSCWHIPRKEGNSISSCLKCGNFVRLTSAQRKHTT